MHHIVPAETTAELPALNAWPVHDKHAPHWMDSHAIILERVLRQHDHDLASRKKLPEFGDINIDRWMIKSAIAWALESQGHICGTEVVALNAKAEAVCELLRIDLSELHQASVVAH